MCLLSNMHCCYFFCRIAIQVGHLLDNLRIYNANCAFDIQLVQLLPPLRSYYIAATTNTWLTSLLFSLQTYYPAFMLITQLAHMLLRFASGIQLANLQAAHINSSQLEHLLLDLHSCYLACTYATRDWYLLLNLCTW